MSKKAEETSWDSAENEVKSSWVKFNVPMEDKIFGTLIAKKTVKSTMPGKTDVDVNVYDLKATEGSYHILDDNKEVVETPVEVIPGAFYSVGGTAIIDRQMQNIRVGQKIGLKFIEEKPSKTKGFAPAKVVKVYAPQSADGMGPLMDQEFLDELAARGE